MQTITIADGQTASAALDVRDGGSLATRSYNFHIPSHTVNVTVQVAESPSGTFKTVNDGFGTDYALVADKFQVLAGLKVGAIKLVADAGVTGDQVFGVSW
jgi:hypothetical protein